MTAIRWVTRWMAAAGPLAPAGGAFGGTTDPRPPAAMHPIAPADGIRACRRQKPGLSRRLALSRAAYFSLYML